MTKPVVQFPRSMRHHTKDKGDIGVAAVTLDLMRVGIQVALPLSEHLPFDLIAISETGIMKKVSVKYRKKNSKGCVELPKASSWADKSGNHFIKHKSGDYDCIAIYCPDNGECYYTNFTDTKSCLILRIDSPLSNQKKNIKLASVYREASVIFVSL